MSVQFLKSSIPQENQSIKVNDCTVRGHSTIAEYLTVTGNVTQSADSTIGGILTMTGTALTGGKIKLPALTEYPQATATNANVAASTGGVAPDSKAANRRRQSPCRHVHAIPRGNPRGPSGRPPPGRHRRQGDQRSHARAGIGTYDGSRS